MSDFSKYIGLPYTCANCWVLVTKIQKEVFDIELPFYKNISPYDSKAILKQIAFEKQSRNWKKVSPHHGCIVLLQQAKYPTHAGIYVEENESTGILHTSEATGCVFQTLQEIKNTWNIEGYYIRKKSNDAVAKNNINTIF